MIVLFEGFQYPTDAIRKVLADRYLDELTGSNRCRITHVGYVFDAPAVETPAAELAKREPVLLLPKVFVDAKKTVFGGLDPVELLDPDSKAWQQLKRDPHKAQFLFRFSVWLYRAIRQFRQRHRDSILPESSGLLDVSDAGDAALSELEIVQALVRFHRDNSGLLTHIKRVNTAQRHSVSWGRTVARQQPVLQNGRPVYVKPLVKQKHINYDEELIVIYLSTLANLQQQYGFRLDLNPLYARLSAREMARFQCDPARMVRRLRDIRGKYFSDKLLRVWQLLHLYYAKRERMHTQRSFREVLVVRDFNIVFEDMIDYMLSDPKDILPTILKDQSDGKRVDHIYAYRDLIDGQADEIYHIGDSKYYGAGSAFGVESVFKQFTYARNVIQQNIDRTNGPGLPAPLRYRDELTEGYNPTPNFFISALVDDTLDFGHDGLRPRTTNATFSNRHFANRLFDRDTLLIQAYNINFLFVLNAYVAGSAVQRDTFRTHTRHLFRNRLVRHLNDTYQFWRVTPVNESLDTFVTRHFRQLLGKLYRPSGFTDALLLALPKQDPFDVNSLNARVDVYDLH